MASITSLLSIALGAVLVNNFVPFTRDQIFDIYKELY